MKNKFKYFWEFCIFSGPEFEILGPENDYFCVFYMSMCWTLLDGSLPSNLLGY